MVLFDVFCNGDRVGVGLTRPEAEALKRSWEDCRYGKVSFKDKGYRLTIEPARGTK